MLRVIRSRSVGAAASGADDAGGGGGSSSSGGGGGGGGDAESHPDASPSRGVGTFVLAASAEDGGRAGHLRVLTPLGGVRAHPIDAAAPAHRLHACVRACPPPCPPASATPTPRAVGSPTPPPPPPPPGLLASPGHGMASHGQTPA
ncbi:hypothetical protein CAUPRSCDRAFT_11652 [Caulochytrium protostelioides]|uniref:Uncharacterized protein n=1 Tax=Caulochytrium protostelioides TaxID=1555241 RepID=A0A4P9WTN6_9FUNG|nr:hypothetical protein CAUPRSCDRAFT_11652 [Caulochytrium protostelioides]